MNNPSFGIITSFTDKIFSCSYAVAGDVPSQTNAVDAEGEREEGDGERERPDPTQLFSVLVHARSLIKFLNAHAVSKTTIACEESLLPHTPRRLTSDW